MPDDRTPPRKIKVKPERPEIWAEGSQRPKFDLRAFAKASLHLTRDGIAPLIAQSADGAAGIAGRVAAGEWRVPVARLGRAERLVPSHQTVSAWISASARILDTASRTAATEGQRRRDRFARTAPSPVPPATPEPALPPVQAAAPDPAPVVLAEPVEDAGTLAAIRAALDDAAQPLADRVAPRAEPARHPAPHEDATPSRVAETLTNATGTALGWALTAVALPYGMVRTTLAHLNGDDLRRIPDED